MEYAKINERCKHTRNTIPLGTIGYAILKIVIRVQVLTRVSLVHQRIFLHTSKTKQ